ncbi:MAG: LysM peptidoglycan-binding domain-containing protein, partial [Planctomycetes bacterium]|nr:LysM peptidoglycan-binding domain-containing protein [Planctomycetota bacterium]
MGEQPSGAADESRRPAGAVETALPPEEAPRRADEPYTVAPGDTFTHIARRMGTTVEHIKLANRKRDDLIRVGDRITVSWRMPSIVIDKAGPRFYLIYRGEVLRSYPCGIGKMDAGSGLSVTPEGVFVIEKKVENPPWWRPGERIE